jgi:hypothetical protein
MQCCIRWVALLGMLAAGACGRGDRDTAGVPEQRRAPADTRSFFCYGSILRAVPRQYGQFMAELVIKNRCNYDLYVLTSPAVLRSASEGPFAWEGAYRENAFARLYVRAAGSRRSFMGERMTAVSTGPAFATVTRGKDRTLPIRGSEAMLKPGSYVAFFQTWIGPDVDMRQYASAPGIDLADRLAVPQKRDASQPAFTVPSSMTALTSNEIQFTIVR